VQNLPTEQQTSKSKKRKRSRVLGGLDPASVLSINDTERDVESEECLQNPAAKLARVKERRVTRQAIYGRAEALYDAKYHPMDEVMHPKRASRHYNRSIRPSSGSESIVTNSASGPKESNGEGNLLPIKLGSQYLGEGSRRSHRLAGRPHPLYNRKKHPQDEFLKNLEGGNVDEREVIATQSHRRRTRSRPVMAECFQTTHSVTHLRIDTEDPVEYEDDHDTHCDIDDGSEDTLSQRSLRSEISDSTLGAGKELSPSRNSSRRTDGATTEDTISVDYHRLPGISEQSRSTMPLSQVPSFYFSSQPSTGQTRTAFVSSAERRRQAANFGIFSEGEELSQDRVARFNGGVFESHEQENCTPTEEQQPSSDEIDNLPIPGRRQSDYSSSSRTR